MGGLMARSADPAVKTQIAANLQRVVRTLRISVKEAAKRVSLPQSQFSGYLRGHRGFAIETLLRLAAGLDCSLDELVRGVDLNYSRQALRRHYPELEEDLELMDVISGFETVRLGNPNEAAGIAAMLKARLPGMGAPEVGAPYAGPSSVEVETKPQRSLPPSKSKQTARR